MNQHAYTWVKSHFLRPGKAALSVMGVWLLARLWNIHSAHRRRRLLRSIPEVRRVSVGPFHLCGQVVDRYTTGGAAADDLMAVAAMLEDAGVPYFLVSEAWGSRHVLGVEEEHRREVLQLARRRFHGTPAYVAAVAGDGTLTFVALWSDGRLPRAIHRARVVRTGTVRLGPDGQLLHSPEWGCEIEFWRRGATIGPARAEKCPWVTVPTRQLGDDFTDSLLSPRPNRVSEVVPAAARKPVTTTVQGHRLQTCEPFAAPGVGDVLFPVDVVYTWVDGEEPAMMAKRQRHLHATDVRIAGREVGPSRYTSHDELRFSLRSLEMYAPFVRHVYLVTDGQVPEWLDRCSPWVTVVDHSEILPADAIPVFNSHAIESCLHHIGGLSDRYLYFNDDVFLNRPVRADTFFHGNGIAKLPFSPYKLGLGDPYLLEPAPNSAGKNARELIRRTFGRNIVGKFQHVPHPQLLSVMREIEAAEFEELRRTTYSKFRSTGDVACAATLHHHWALLSGRAVPAEYSLRYVDLGKPDVQQRLARLTRGEDVDFFCINDVDTGEGVREVAVLAVRSFLERRFPFPSRAEQTEHAEPGRRPGTATSRLEPATGSMSNRPPVKLEASA